MSIGLNRQNDTPIGGAGEFRGNMQTDGFSVGDAAIFDGEKFAAGTTDVTLRGYGGLATNLNAGIVADGSIIGSWDETTPVNSTPQQTVVDKVLGTVTVSQAGVYDIAFTAAFGAMINNQAYEFRFNLNGVSTDFGSDVQGSNSVATQSTAFNLLYAVNAGDVFGVDATNAANSTFDILSASVSITRIG